MDLNDLSANVKFIREELSELKLVLAKGEVSAGGPKNTENMQVEAQVPQDLVENVNKTSKAVKDLGEQLAKLSSA